MTFVQACTIKETEEMKAELKAVVEEVYNDSIGMNGLLSGSKKLLAEGESREEAIATIFLVGVKIGWLMKSNA